MPRPSAKKQTVPPTGLPLRRTRHSRHFPGQFPAEVLLLIFEHFVVREPDFTPRGEGDPSDALRALCLISRSFNALATGLLYRHVRCWKRIAAEDFLRTAESDRWTTGEMKGKMKQWVRSIQLNAFRPLFGTQSNDTVLVGQVLAAVDQAKIALVRLGGLWLRFSTLAPLTSKPSSGHYPIFAGFALLHASSDLRRLDLDSTCLVLDRAPLQVALPALTDLRLRNPSCTAQAEPHEPESGDDPFYLDWDVLLCPAALPALASLTLDVEGEDGEFLGEDPGGAALHALLGQLAELRTCELGVRIETELPATWRALVRLRRLSMWAYPDYPWDGAALRCALAHLPGPLDALDLSCLDEHGLLPAVMALREALVRGDSAAADLKAVVLPGPGQWGERGEGARVEQVALMAQSVRGARGEQVRIEYAAGPTWSP